MLENLLTTIGTVIAGIVASIWSYWTGRKKTASENSKARAEALHELNEIIDLMSKKLNDLQEEILKLSSENLKLSQQNERLLSNQETLKSEIEALRKELSIYKRPQQRKKPLEQ